MEKVCTITSNVAPLPLDNVDTDMILPAQYLTAIGREGYGKNLFRRLRDREPDFPLNLERHRGAKILAAGANFGCGSSREHAVWALLGGGFRAVVAKSFADIFYNNAAKNGLLLAALRPEIVDRILGEAQGGGYAITVDLETQTVALPDGAKAAFDYDPFRKHCLLNGLDDIDYILAYEAEIGRFRESREPYYFSSENG
jgi:3-isopropylmalate/(R)-2-methylmalate dehydratase small subunit